MTLVGKIYDIVDESTSTPFTLVDVSRWLAEARAKKAAQVALIGSELKAIDAPIIRHMNADIAYLETLHETLSSEQGLERKGGSDVQ